MDYFVHQNALVESETIGTNTRLWAFVHVLPEDQKALTEHPTDNNVSYTAAAVARTQTARGAAHEDEGTRGV